MMCEICYDDIDKIKSSCCGFNVCYMCDFKSYGACYIHEREKINLEIECDCCEEIATTITAGICEYCDKQLCLKCISVYEFGLCICYDEKCLEKVFIEMYSDDYWACSDCSPDDCCSDCEIDKDEFIRLHSK